MNKFLFKTVILFLFVQITYQNTVFAKKPSLNAFFTESISGSEVTFTATVTSTSPVEYAWDFGDMYTYSWSSNNVVQHMYATPGVYAVSLYVRNTEGDLDTLVKAISITGITANFSFLPDTVYELMNVQFHDSSVSQLSPITEWAWDFGNGSIESTQQNPSQGFWSGQRQITLTVKNSIGQQSSITKPLIVRKALIPGFIYSPDTIRAGMPVQFTDNTIINTGSIASHFWWFGGSEGYSYLQNPVHIFNLPGIYNVSHTVSNSYGENDTIIKPIQVLDAVSKAHVNFTYGPDPVYINSTTQFVDQSITFEGTATSWQWHFGDGGTSTDQNPSHVYTRTGSFGVYLILGNSSGILDTLARQVIVTLRPEQKNICVGGDAVLHAEQTGTTYRWLQSWDGGTVYGYVSNGAHYSGATTQDLTLINVSSSTRGWKYKCLVNSASSNPEYTIAFQNQYNGTGNWENSSNWSCGALPDENTDVIIAGGTVTINSNVTCRSLTVLPGANVVVTTGYTLTVLH